MVLTEISCLLYNFCANFRNVIHFVSRHNFFTNYENWKRVFSHLVTFTSHVPVEKPFFNLQHVHMNNWNATDEYWGANEGLLKSASSVQSKWCRFVSLTSVTPEFGDQQWTATVMLTLPDVWSPFPLCFCRILSHVHHWNCGGFRKTSECVCISWSNLFLTGLCHKTLKVFMTAIVVCGLWVSTPCSLVGGYWRSEEIFCLIL
jgi:hypothetical protein